MKFIFLSFNLRIFGFSCLNPAYSFKDKSTSFHSPTKPVLSIWIQKLFSLEYNKVALAFSLQSSLQLQTFVLQGMCRFQLMYLKLLWMALCSAQVTMDSSINSTQTHLHMSTILASVQWIRDKCMLPVTCLMQQVMKAKDVNDYTSCV